MKRKTLVAAGSAVLVLGLLASALFRPDSQKPLRAGAPAVTTPAPRATRPPAQPVIRERPRRTGVFTPGEVHTVSATRSSVIPVALSLAAYQEMHKSILAGDTEGLVELARKGQASIVEPGDSVRVLDFNAWNGRIEGRMVSGKLAGTRVWMPSKYLE